MIHLAAMIAATFVILTAACMVFGAICGALRLIGKATSAAVKAVTAPIR